MLRAIGGFLADVFGITQLRDGHAALGGLRFWTILGLTLGWIGLWAWLEITATWPGTCDHEGRRLMRFVKELRCSPDLLSGGPREIALFVFLWVIPSVLAGALVWRARFEWRKHSRRIRPMAD